MRGALMTKVNAPLIFSFILVVAGTLSAANASPTTIATASATSITTDSIIAFPALTSSGANPNGLALTLANTSLPQYFYVRNTGSIDIVAITITVTYSSTTAKKTFLHCNQNTAFSGTNTCASGSSTLVNGSGVLSINLVSGSWYAFEIDAKKVVTPTISVSVSTSQIRTVLNTNS